MPFCEIIASSVPLNIDWQQILLHLLNFVILAVGLTLLIYRPVKKFLDKRKKSFEDREKNISESKREAEDMKTEYEKKLGDADLEIQLRSAAAKNKAEEDARRTVYKADAEASAILGRARSGAEAQKRKLLRSAGRDITDMVVGATEKLLAASQSEKTDLALYDKFVSDKTAYIGAEDLSDDEREALIAVKKADAEAEEILRAARSEAASEAEKLLEEAKEGIDDAVAAATEKMLVDISATSDSEIYDKFLAENARSDDK